MKTINQIIAGAQAFLNLSYDIKRCFEEYLSDAYKTFLHMLRVIEDLMPTLIRPYAGNGRIPYQYTPFIRSFLAKGYFGIEKTSQLIQRLKGEPNRRLLCGFTKAPGKAVFSRPLRLLSEQDILEKTPDRIVSMAHKDLVVSWGCKKNSAGNVSCWKGYKLHLDVSDSGFPLTAVVTGANVHDSQLAIPMEQLTEMKVFFCYSLMDSAYDSAVIDGYIRSRGRIPIIDPNKRKDNDRPPLDPAKQERYTIRTTVERAKSHLKDSRIPRSI